MNRHPFTAEQYLSQPVGADFCKPEPPREIPSKIQFAHEAISNLERLADSLLERIRPIIRPLPTGKSQCTGDSALPPQASLSNEIDQITLRANHLSDRIAEAIDALAI